MYHSHALEGWVNILSILQLTTCFSTIIPSPGYFYKLLQMLSAWVMVLWIIELQVKNGISIIDYYYKTVKL